MPKEFSRTDRLNETLKRILAELIQKEMNDPRLKRFFLTILELVVTKDLTHAKVYFSLLGEPTHEDIEVILSILKKGTGFMRKRIGQEITTRIVPNLHFIYDPSLIEGEKLRHLIDTISRENDAT